MKNHFLSISWWLFLAGSPTAVAEPVQSTTSAYVSLRDCIAGDTLCDSIGPSRFKAIGGAPGSPEAQASQQNPEFGEAQGTARLSGEPGAATLQVESRSLPAVRNAATAFVLQRIANSSAGTQALTFEATLAYEQQVPEQNAAFPEDTGVQSGAIAELELFSMPDEFMEVGTTAEENWAIMDGGLPPGYQSIGNAHTEGLASTVTARDNKAFSVSVVLEPGASVWMFALLQGIATSGAVVDARLDISLVISSD